MHRYQQVRKTQGRRNWSRNKTKFRERPVRLSHFSD
jgi:hypothetical protein